jgi:hypothetical protein
VDALQRFTQALYDPDGVYTSMQRKLRDYLDTHPRTEGEIIARLQRGETEALADLAKLAKLDGRERDEMLEVAQRHLGSDFAAELSKQAPLQFQGKAGAGSAIADAKLSFDLGAQVTQLVKEMTAAWPKDFAGDFPPEFLAKADALQALKHDALAALGAKPKKQALHDLIAIANQMHRKAGHSENLVRVGAKVVSELRKDIDALGIDPWRVLDALPWLNLADLDVHVKYLSASRKLTDVEMAERIVPRAQRSAEMFARFGLGDATTREVVENHRIFQPKARSLAAQLADLLDDITAMAAKPFFQKDGSVDAQKVAGEIGKKVDRLGIDRRVFDIAVKALEQGVVDRGLKEQRSDDVYVR